MLVPDEMPARLASFLAIQEPTASDIEVASYGVLTGGYSRLLGKASISWTIDGQRLHRTFVLRGDPPLDKQLIVTDRRQEFGVLRAVAPHVATSAAVYLDATGEHLGTPALVIDFVDADSLLPFMAGRPDNTDLVAPLAETLAAFQRTSLTSLPDTMARPASWNEYISQRIDEWRRAALNHAESEPIMRYLAAWLNAHRPAPVELTLIHGDFQSANLMRSTSGELVVLDWELAQIGDPREDIGYFKAVSQAAGPDVIALDEDEFCRRYRKLTGMTEAQLNPAVIAYFLILGVVGTVRQLLEGGAAYAAGKNTAINSLFSLSSVQFGHSMWLPATEQLEAVFAMAEGAN